MQLDTKKKKKNPKNTQCGNLLRKLAPFSFIKTHF